jgi:hypothetical protein
LGLELRQIVPKKITNPKNLAGQQTAATPILLFSLSYMPRCVFFPPLSTPTHFPTLVDDLFSRLAIGGAAAAGCCRIVPEKTLGWLYDGTHLWPSDI